MKREGWIDISRGIVMIMVILGHTGSFLIGKGLEWKSMSVYFMLTSAIKIPGFLLFLDICFMTKMGTQYNLLKINF